MGTFKVFMGVFVLITFVGSLVHYFNKDYISFSYWAFITLFNYITYTNIKD